MSTVPAVRGIVSTCAEGLRREGYGSRSAEPAGELGEDRQIGVQPDPVESTDAEGQSRPFVLQPAELALDRPRLASEVSA
jgi:hypothetical protein